MLAQLAQAQSDSAHWRQQFDGLKQEMAAARQLYEEAQREADEMKALAQVVMSVYVYAQSAAAQRASPSITCVCLNTFACLGLATHFVTTIVSSFLCLQTKEDRIAELRTAVAHALTGAAEAEAVRTRQAMDVEHLGAALEAAEAAAAEASRQMEDTQQMCDLLEARVEELENELRVTSSDAQAAEETLQSQLQQTANSTLEAVQAMFDALSSSGAVLSEPDAKGLNELHAALNEPLAAGQFPTQLVAMVSTAVAQHIQAEQRLVANTISVLSLVHRHLKRVSHHLSQDVGVEEQEASSMGSRQCTAISIQVSNHDGHSQSAQAERLVEKLAEVQSMAENLLSAAAMLGAGMREAVNTRLALETALAASQTGAGRSADASQRELAALRNQVATAMQVAAREKADIEARCEARVKTAADHLAAMTARAQASEQALASTSASGLAEEFMHP